ncbi:hypothetical protein [Streptomyces sp. NPDC051173]|uniref:hypothetical protein n=1 Tax=Streptomyces sp. NPDC051173 TaxID=3155164 RepID=UPI00344F8817
MRGEPEFTWGNEPGGSIGEGFAHAVRGLSLRLVALDNEPGGPPAADAAVRAFAAVRRSLRERGPERRYERDVLAATAELAEVAGWVLFDAERPGEAAGFNRVALCLARRSGDRATELLTLQNVALASGWSGRPRGELAVARSVLDRGRLSPRVEAVFRVREARGLAGTGRSAEAARSFARARSLLAEGERHGDPFWAWWMTADEVDGHQGFVLQEAGERKAAVHHLRRAALQEEGAGAGYRHIFAVRLLDCLLGLHAWREAEEVAEGLVPVAAAGIASARTRGLLDGLARPGRGLPGSAPGGLREVLEHLAASAGQSV